MAMLTTGQRNLCAIRPQARRICALAPISPRQQCRKVSAASSRAAVLASPTDDYLRNKLDTILSGLHNATRRQDARVLKVLHVSRAGYTHNALNKRPRCGRLDLDLLWESKPIKLPATEPLQGLARVTLSTTGSSDRVDISDVQLLAASDDDAPRMPSAEPTPPDVLLAVEALDGVIMQHLNDFLWELEQSQDFMLSSMECEDADDEQVQKEFSTAAPKAL